MGKFKGVAITAGLIAGFITFAITVFFMPPQRALAIGILSSAIVTFLFSLVSDISFKKYRNLDQTIDQDIILKNIANYYSDRLIGDGLLYLTKDRLIFLFFKKRKLYREEIPFTEIERATYGTLFRNILGLKLFMNDSTVKGFVINDIEQFLEHINKKTLSNKSEVFKNTEK